MSNAQKARLINVGQRGVKLMPASEVCLHMKITDKPMIFELVSNRAVQLYNMDGTPFSFPILTGEAGIFTNYHKEDETHGEVWEFYYYPNELRELGDNDLFNHELNLNNAEKPPVE